MDAITLGPLMLPLTRLPGLVALIIVLLVSELLNKKYPGLARWGWMTVLAAALGGRLFFAANLPSAYLAEPWTLFYFWQPGYSPWGALGAAFVFTLWYVRKKPRLQWAAPGLLAVAGLAGFLTLALVHQPPEKERLPALTLQTLEGQAVNLQDYQGQPLLVNLWATWCPPCRREMPLLESYEQDERLQVLLLNQGESLLTLRNYLEEGALTFQHPLLDSQQAAMQFYQAPGLPATLFYNAQGELVKRHFGELSRAQIEAFIQAPD